MILNDVNLDLKIKCLEEGITQTEIAKTIGSSRQAIFIALKNEKGVMNRTFVKAMEALGYNIRLVYEPIDKE